MIKPIIASLLCAAILAFGKASASTQAPEQRQHLSALSYNQLIGAGYDLLREGRIGEAYLAATRAAVKDPNRFEAYALAALALHVQGSDKQAKPFADKALRLAPPAKQHLVKELNGQISARILAAPAAAHTSEPLSPDMRRKLDALHMIIQDADRAATPLQHTQYLQEFLDKSESFVTEYPNEVQVWLLRGAVALKMSDGGTGMDAAFHLMKLGVDKSEDEKVRRVMANMDREGWIYDMNLKVEPQVAALSSLLKAMGTFSVNETQGPAQFSYGDDLTGSCSSGFDVEFGENHTYSSMRYREYSSATVHLELAQKFFSRGVYLGVDHPFVAVNPLIVRNKRGHRESFDQYGASKVEDDEPQFFDLGVRDSEQSKELANILNKLHWACMLQSDTAQAVPTNR